MTPASWIAWLVVAASATARIATVQVPVDASHASPPSGLAAPAAGPAYGTYVWPVNGPVLRSFEPPAGPYAPGHRGIDIGAPLGTPIVAAGDGVVAFAGWVAGSLFVSIDHPDGVRTTYSWLSSIAVSKGQTVAGGAVIAATGHGHPEVPVPHLHFGARVGSVYIDPMLLLEGGSVVGLIHLAPLNGAAPTMGGLGPAPALGASRRERAPPSPTSSA
jgi:murein DD-endopeptidase MepM/ murein hydrolase activator NlpD